jgi:hypothetical protein
MNKRDDDFSLLRTIPAVLRARGYRLYTKSGRLVDLWQNGGSAVLGHTPPSFLKEIKNTASRGLYAPFPHFTEGRFTKALSCLFPERSFRFYACPPPGLEELFKNNTAALWRPFLEPKSPFIIADNAPPILIPVLPGIQSWRGELPLGLCVLAAAHGADFPLPAGDILSPVLLAAAARGIYDLIAASGRANPSFPRIEKVLKKSQWRRRGIYLSLPETPTPETWAALFRRFLEAGFLVPPVPYQPLILPGVLSPGEEAKLAEVLVSA